MRTEEQGMGVNKGILLMIIISCSVALFLLNQIENALKLDLDFQIRALIMTGVISLIVVSFVIAEYAWINHNRSAIELLSDVKSRLGIFNYDKSGVLISLLAVIILVLSGSYLEAIIPFLALLGFLVFFSEIPKVELKELKVRLKPLAEVDVSKRSLLTAEDIQTVSFKWTFVSRSELQDSCVIFASIDFSKTRLESLLEGSEKHGVERATEAAILCLSREGMNSEIYQIAASVRNKAIEKKWADVHEIEAVLEFAAQMDLEQYEESQLIQWRYPSVTMWDKKGSELDRNTLAAAILLALGYKIALFDFEGVIAIGIDIGEQAYIPTIDLIEGQYIFCQIVVNDDKWIAGGIPEEFKGRKHEKYELSNSEVQ